MHPTEDERNTSVSPKCQTMSRDRDQGRQAEIPADDGNPHPGYARTRRCATFPGGVITDASDRMLLFVSSITTDSAGV